MEERLIKLLNCNEEFRNHIQDFIEIFVLYYGEEEREYIEEKFNSALLIGYLSENELEQVIYVLDYIKSNEIFQDIINKTPLNVTERELFGRDLRGNYTPFEFKTFHPINTYGLFYDECMLGEEGRKQKFYKIAYESLCERVKDISFEEYMQIVDTKEIPEKHQNKSDELKQLILHYTDISYLQYSYESKKKSAVEFLKKIDSDSTITMENIEETIHSLTEVNELLEHYRKSEQEYKKFREKYSKYYNMVEYNKKLKQELSEKYYKDFLIEIFDEIPEQYRAGLNKYLESNNKGYLDYTLRQLVGMDIDSVGLFEYFTDEMNDKMNDDNTDEWEKDSIRRNRIEYFKSIGFNLGDDYEEYLNNSNIWPSKDTITKIMQIKKEKQNGFYIYYYNNMLPQKDRVEEERSKGFLEIDEKDSAQHYMHDKGRGITCICPNIIKEGNEYKIAAEVIVNFDSVKEKVLDHYIVHELNHLYELGLVKVNSEMCEFVCGWEYICANRKNSDKSINLNKPKRPYELFNEIINEKIAKCISEIMVERGIEIFGKAIEESYKYVTDYDATGYLVDEFFETYKKEILASRKNNNLQIILDAVGKENFDALNQLFQIHYENFRGLSYYALKKVLDNNREPEKTKIFIQLKQKRDEILSKMKEHYKIYTNNKIKKDIKPTESDLKASIEPIKIAKSIRRFNPKELTNNEKKENGRGEI